MPLTCASGKGHAEEPELELEHELTQPHMAQKPMMRGDGGSCVRVIRACGQRREKSYGRAR